MPDQRKFRPQFRKDNSFQAFTDKYSAEQAKRVRPVRPLVEGISGTHQIVDEPAEGIRRLSRAAVRLGQNDFKNIGDPTVIVARRAV